MKPMAQASVHISGSSEPLHKWIAELSSIAKSPVSFQTTAKCEVVLRDAFGDTQARTHVISGSLKASGKVSSDYDGHVWSGEISYGGPLTGSPTPGPPPPNGEVVYAIYEMARGGAHDFFGGLPVYEEKFQEVVNDMFNL